MTKASDNIFPKVTFVEGSAPSSPSASDFHLYFDSSDHLLKFKNSAGSITTLATGSGSVATDTIWDAAGDLVQGTGADAAAKLSAGTAGYFLKAGGAATANAWAARELDYVPITTGVNITATTEATATTIVTGSAVSYDGSTIVMIEFFSPEATPNASDNSFIRFVLYDGSSSIGYFGISFNPKLAGGSSIRMPVKLERRLTPSNASHTYSVRAYVDTGTGTVAAGAGGTATYVPAFIRITRAV